MSQRRKNLSPTLFPFLAVLVCTLGTLILLLALVAQNAASSADAADQRTAQQNKQVPPGNKRALPSAEDAENLLREEEFRLEALISFRNLQTTDLENKRDELTHLESHIARLEQRLQSLEKEILSASQSKQSDVVKESDVLEISEKIKATQKAIAQLKKDQTKTDPRVVIVPHQGPNGTERRAVYVECTSDGVTIMPEGSKITIEQLNRSNLSANPLDAALRVIRLHAMQVYEDPISPYPLLVVRPNGIKSYAAARKAMTSWDDQFGYELVASETELAFPVKDRVLRKTIDEAIQKAIDAQTQFATVASLGDVAKNRGGLSGNKTRRMKQQNLPTLSAAAMERSGRANGYHQLSNDYRSFPSLSPNSGNPSHNRYPSTVTYDPPKRDQSTSTNTSNQFDPHSKTAGKSKELPNKKAGPSYTLPHGSPNPAQSGSVLQPSAENGQASSFTALPPPSTQSENHSVSMTLPGGTSEGNVTEPFGSSKNQAAPESVRNEPAEAYTAESIQISKDTNNSSTESVHQGSLTDGAESALGQSANSATSPSLADKPPADSNGSASRMSTTLEPPSDERLRLNQPPPPNWDHSKPAHPLQKTLLEKKGRNWAIPNSVGLANGNAIIRTLRMECYSDRLILRPSRQNASTEIFSFFDSNIERASLQLASTVHDRIEQWGPALPGGHWLPQLEIFVSEEGESAYARLLSHLRGSGLELIRKGTP